MKAMGAQGWEIGSPDSLQRVKRIGDNVPEVLTKRWVRISISAAIALALLLLAELASPQTVDDDYSISVALSGILPDSGLCLFVNAALARFVLVLNSGLPGLNVFLFLLYVLTFVSISVLSYEMLTRCNSLVLFLAVLGPVVLLALPMCTYQDNFSNVSALASMVGGTLVIVEMTEKEPSYALCVIGVILSALGFSLRMYSALLSASFLVVLLAARLYRVFCAGSTVSFSIARAAWMIAPLVICGALFVYDVAAWSEPGWAEWKELNGYRSQIADYPMPDYEEVADELAQLGLSEIDYKFALTLRTGDLDVFTSDAMREIAQLSRQVDHPPLLGPDGVGRSLVGSILDEPSIILACITMLACLGANWRRLSLVERMGAVAILAMAFLECALLLYLGRYLYRLSSFIWCDAVLGVGILTCFPADRVSESDKGAAHLLGKPLSAALGAAVAACSLVLVVLHGAPLSFSNAGLIIGWQREARLQESVLASYVSERPDRVFVMDVFAGERYEAAHSMRLLPDGSDRLRVLFLGGWSTGAPYSKAINDRVVTGNPLKALIEDDRVLLITMVDEMEVDLEAYLEERYYNDVEYELVDTFTGNDGNEFYVYDFSLGKGSTW